MKDLSKASPVFLPHYRCAMKTAKMAGHLVQLGSTLTPKEYTYIMKLSLCPLVQLSLSPCLCSPADLKFSKLCLTPQEAKEEIGIKQCLLRPFHLTLAVLAPKHPTCCLAAVIHTVLQRHLFNSKESTSTISEEFQVTPKTLYEGLTRKQHDPGQNSPKQKKLHEKL